MLLESIPPFPVNTFTRSEDLSVSEMVVGVVHLVVRVDLSHLDSRALHCDQLIRWIRCVEGRGVASTLVLHDCLLDDLANSRKGWGN